VAWIFRRAGLPVEITRETTHGARCATRRAPPAGSGPRP
jgi:SH3-like domain-containing protein